MRHKLRLGLLISDWNISAWQYDMLVEVLNSDYASIDLIIESTSKNCNEFRRGLAAWIFGKFGRFDTAHSSGTDPCENINARELLGEVDRITILSASDTSADREHASNIASIKEKKLDVVLALDDISPIDTLVDACRYGVWFYDYSYSISAQPDLSWVGFQEVLRREPFMHSALMVRSAKFQTDRVTYRSYSSVNPRSHAITRSKHLWKIRSFVPRALRNLYLNGGDQFFQKLQTSTFTQESNHALSPLGTRGFSALITLISYSIWRLKWKISRKYFNQKWTLLFQLGGNSRELASYTKLHPPKDWFWADPFAVRKNEYYYIFFEEASVASGHGHLSVIRMDVNGNCSRPRRILEKPYHLSYPFIFEWKQTLYLIPESAGNRTIEVYRCTEFPYQWEFECKLMEGVSAYDATLFEHDDTWWLFANTKEHEGASGRDELCLFSSDHPLSNDWRPHPMNPIISDVRRARPAGNIIRRNGRIIRPSQNSSYRYGYALNFCEILELTKTNYKERLVECIEPNWDPSIKALHTYNECGELTVIDAVHRSRRFAR